MLTPLDLERIQESLRTPNGWIELGAIALCFAIAWAVDRRVHVTSERESRVARLGAGSVNRLIFPLTTLALLLVARAVFRHWQVPAFFPIAIPLVVALALIRLSSTRCATSSACTRASGVGAHAQLRDLGRAAALLRRRAAGDRRGARGRAASRSARASVSLLDLGRDAIVIVVAIVLSLWASGLIEQRLMRGTHLDRNVRVVLAKVFRALLLLIGVLIALSFVGIDLTVLSVFGGALGVGIGLGLQKLASNYIAGFTILLDRSIRLGDMITVDNRFGTVSKVTSRYVVVRSLDGVEAIVPNETLVTTTVLNHSYTSKDVKRRRPGADQLRQRSRAGDAADGPSSRRASRASCRARCAPVVNVLAVRRQRHRPRACGLDQRPGKRPGQPEIGAEPRHLEGVSRQRHHGSPTRSAKCVSSARPARRQGRQTPPPGLIACTGQSVRSPVRRQPMKPM